MEDIILPGFNIGGYGGDQPSNVAEPRRTHRWVFTALGRGSSQFSRQELLFLKSAARPKFKFEEAKMDHNEEEAFFAGKRKWEPIEMTWYDIEQSPDISLALYKWLGAVGDLQNANTAHPSTYKKTGVLSMLSGVGAINEQWTMYGAWPQDFDWKTLDYTSSEIQMAVVKLRYDRALRSCLNLAGIVGTSSNCG